MLAGPVMALLPQVPSRRWIHSGCRFLYLIAASDERLDIAFSSFRLLSQARALFSIRLAA